jgi:hypothetical protein
VRGPFVGEGKRTSNQVADGACADKIIVPGMNLWSGNDEWGWCRLRDSNTRPSHYECDALPTELKRLIAY